MVADEDAGHPRAWGRRARVPVFFAGAVLGALIVGGSLLLDPGVFDAARSLGIRIDARHFDGRVRRWYHGESLPVALQEGEEQADPRAYDWLGGERFLPIAHGLGPQLFAGEDSLTTLTQGLEMGFRVFEVDLTLTRDGELVCYHGQSDEDLDTLTSERYLASVKQRGMEPCRFADLLRVAGEHPSLRFVLDVKNGFEKAYTLARDAARRAGVGRSFVPQVYRFEQVAIVRKDGVFAGEIFTSYRSALTTRQIFDAARRSGTRVVTLTTRRFQELEGGVPADLHALVHPVNDPFQAMDIRQKGGRGIYSSYLTPRTVPELFRELSEDCQPPRRFACGDGEGGLTPRGRPPNSRGRIVAPE